MDDMMTKINEVLSDKESMEQLRQLAGMLGLDGQGGGTESSPPPPAPSGSMDMPFDAETLMRLGCLMQSVSGSDKNSDLLLALRPHLSPERTARVDKAVRLLRAFALFSAARESGLLDKLDIF